MTAATLRKIQAERVRQDERWGPRHFQPLTPERILAVLVEEVGEVAQAIDALEETPPDHPAVAQSRRDQLEAEIVQVAAVAAAWLDQCFSDPEEGERP